MIHRSIYLASSWRNAYQETVLAALRADLHRVYDFKHPKPGDDGFSWSEIDHDWQQWSGHQYLAALQTPIAERGFGNDKGSMVKADTCVLLLPSGASAHIEAGWMKGAGKDLFILAMERPNPELMYKLADGIALNLNDLLEMLARPVVR